MCKTSVLNYRNYWIFSFNRLYQIRVNEEQRANEAVKNGSNWPIHTLRLSGTEPSTLQTTCGSLHFKGKL